MRPSSRSTELGVDDAERGSAALEFIVVGLILLVPLVYLVLAPGLIQGQSLGVEAGARHIAQAGATLVVTVRTTVALPLVPPVLGLDRLASIPIEASSAHKVSRFWGTG